jgi:hypothetical protein
MIAILWVIGIAGIVINFIRAVQPDPVLRQIAEDRRRWERANSLAAVEPQPPQRPASA